MHANHIPDKRETRAAKRHDQYIYIVTPCLNASETLDQAIASVIYQAGNFSIRYHVQDGGSTDGTIDLLKKWTAALSAENPDLKCRQVDFTWTSEPDQGMYDGLVRGFDRFNPASWEFMTWLNGDDLLLPGALSIIGLIATDWPQIQWIGGPKYIVDSGGRKIFERRFPTPTGMIRQGLCDGKHWYFLQQEGTFFRKALWQKGRSALSGYQLAGDWNLWREFARHECYYQLSRPLGAFRKRRGQASEAKMDHYMAELEAAVPLKERRALFQSLYKEEGKYGNLVQYNEAPGTVTIEKDYQSVQDLFDYFWEKNRFQEQLTEPDQDDRSLVAAGEELVPSRNRAELVDIKPALYREIKKLTGTELYHNHICEKMAAFFELSAQVPAGSFIKSKTFWGAPIFLIPHENVSSALFSCGVFEPELSAFLVEFLKPGQVVIDIGAHLGYFSMLAAELIGERGRVVSFEPTPSTFDLLSANTGAYDQVTVVPALVWNKKETLDFKTFNPAFSAFNTAVSDRLSETKRRAAGGQIITVEAAPLDHYCEQWNLAPDLVKIDAESSELQVLQGMAGLLKTVRPLVTLEVGDLAEPAGSPLPLSRDLLKLVHSYGYVAVETLGLRLKNHVMHACQYEYDNIIMVPKEHMLACNPVSRDPLVR